MQPELPPQAVLMQMLFGFSASRAIGLAAELGIADHIKDQPKTADALALETQSHPRSLYRLLRACASVGVFSENEKHEFSLTPMADLLRSDAPQSLRDFAIMITDNIQYKTWGQLDHSVKTGEPAAEVVVGMPLFEYYVQNEKQGKVFNNAMTSMSMGSSFAVLEAYDFSDISKIVDIGGGHGFLIASILQKYPAMHGILFDTAPIVEGAKSLLQNHGVAARCETVGGDFFQTAPAGGDAYIMKHIIHDWNDEQCITILKHCRKGIQDLGKLLVVEMVVPEGNTPSLSKFLDLQMLAVLPGCERTEAEYALLFEKAGFQLTRIVPTMSPYSVIEGIAV